MFMRLSTVALSLAAGVALAQSSERPAPPADVNPQPPASSAAIPADEEAPANAVATTTGFGEPAAAATDLRTKNGEFVSASAGSITVKVDGEEKILPLQARQQALARVAKPGDKVRVYYHAAGGDDFTPDKTAGLVITDPKRTESGKQAAKASSEKPEEAPSRR